MKRARIVWMGAVLLTGCGVLVSLGRAQFGGTGQAPVVCCANATVVGPPTVMRHLGLAELKILEALGQPADFEFIETPLSEFVHFVKDKHDLQIFLDTTVLSDAGIDPTTLPITTDLKGVSLRSALDLILEAQDLTWLITDEVMKITTKEKADSTFETRLYDVRDLTTDDRDPMGPPDFDSLIKMIVATVKGNWQEGGGGATIRGFSNSGIRALVVAQTYNGHEQIESLLAELRKMKPRQ